MKKAFLHQLNLQEEDCTGTEDARLIPAWGCALMAKQQPSEQHPLLSEMLADINNEEKNSFQDQLFKRLPALFHSEAEFEKWKKEKGCHEVACIDWEQMEDTDCFLGIDSGSTTTKIVLIDKQKRIVFQDYLRNEGDSFHAMLKGMLRLQAEAEKHRKK